MSNKVIKRNAKPTGSLAMTVIKAGGRIVPVSNENKILSKVKGWFKWQ